VVGVVIGLRSTRVFIGGRFVPRDVVVADGHIAEHAPHGSVPWARDIGDARLTPGFVDLQVNGAYGHDFTTEPTAIWTVAERLPEHGVTAFCPTVITGPDGTIAAAIDVLAARPKGFVGAEPLGLHLEGPMLAPERRGVHPAEHLRQVDTSAWWPPAVRIATVAPEVAGAEVIGALAERGVIVSVGHSDVAHDEGMDAFDAGARMVTHLCNAMRPLHHREPGLVGAALDDPRVTVAMITDGIHAHPTTVRLVHRLVGPDRFVATTDAVAAAGLPPGRFVLGGTAVESDGVAVRADDGTLAGSVVTMNESVVRLANLVGLGMEASVVAHSEAPARRLGEDHRGVLEVGARADLVAFGDDGSVRLTIVGGEIVHEA
jgi:N-acetylglucosamine-6-phosphate deacetylase